MHGHISFRRSKHKSQFRNGHRAAVLRAVTSASILLGRPIKASSQARAAELCGANVQYVEAAVWLLQAEDSALIADVLAGRISLLKAAAKVRRRSRLIAAYQDATADDRAAFGEVVGAASVWDEVIAPKL
jgi:hypothetical protein